MPRNFHRREFLALAGATTVAAQEKPVRVGVVGVGNRGTALVKNLLDLPGVTIPAICDINEENLSRSQALVEAAKGGRAEGYSKGTEDYRRMVERPDLDAIVTATPWELHAPVCVAAMKAGKYAATEVPAAITTEECWDLVNTSERTGMPCMLLENVNYHRNVLMILGMIQQGIFGEIIHCEAGYQHDIRGGTLRNGQLRWRTMHAVRRNANLYPTHPIGPVAWWTEINRGDRFTYLVSMSSKSQGMNHYVAKHFGADHPNAKLKFARGDVNTSLIMTENGATVTLYHDTQLPRPYDLILRVQGTDAIYSGTLDKIYIEGRSPKLHTWEDPAPYYEKYEHPLWKKLGPVARNYGHGGGDYMELDQFIRAVRNRTQTPIDVYDAATWSVITPLTEQSIAGKSRAVDFPDFTRGKWKNPRKIEFAL
jgi:predicted dehydrogenase